MGHSLTVDLQEISKDRFIRTDVDHYSIFRNLQKQFNNLPERFVPLGRFIAFMETGQPIERSDYSAEPTPYIHLVVRNIKKGELVLDDPIYLTETKGEELANYRLRNGDFVIAISSNVGECFLFDSSTEESQLTLSHYLARFRVNELEINPEFLINYLNSEIMRSYFRACEAGKDLKNLSKFYIRSLPFPLLSRREQDQIQRTIREQVDSKVEVAKKKLEALQDKIDRIFLQYEIKKTREIKTNGKWFTTDLINVGHNEHVRCGPKYRGFWDIRRGYLFGKEDSKYQIVKFHKIIKPAQKRFVEKGELDREWYLLELDDLEKLSGRILNPKRSVIEVGSEKVIFGKCDLLMSKIRPYLGQVLINDPNLPYIGSSELVPLIVDKKKADLRFVRYLLLSYEFLEQSKNLMYGKEQPRISIQDVLDIKTICPDITVQQEIADKLEKEEAYNNSIQEEINALIAGKDILIMKCLSDQQKLTTLNKMKEI